MNESTYRVLIHKRQKTGLAEIPAGAVTAILVDYGDRVLAEVTAAQQQQLVTAGFRVEDLREQNKIRVGTMVVEPALSSARATRNALPPLAATAEEAVEPQYYLIQFIGPVKPEWLEQLRAAGVNPLAYYHDFSYLVQGSAAAVAQAAMAPVIQTYMPYEAEFTLQPMTRAALTTADAAEGREVWLLLFTTSDISQATAQIEALGGEILEEEAPSGFYQRFHVRVPQAALDDLAAMTAIYMIEPYMPRQAEDEVANQIIAGNLSDLRQPLLGYTQWLQRMDVDGSGVTIGINDEGIDETHPAFTGRVRKLFGTRSPHGTMVAGQAAGNYLMAQTPDTDSQLLDSLGFAYGVGVAPGADLLDIQSADECVTQTGVRSNDVGRIINNSWGKGVSPIMDYRSEERAWDGHVRDANPAGTLLGAAPAPLVVCFSAGNSGAQGLTRPKAAKNSIVTGNFENFRPDLFGVDADDIDNRVPKSSLGNCADGRIKPDVVAPGEHTAAAAFPQPGDICHFLRFGGGTSAASPKTAGACALLIQWWRQHHSRNGVPQTPSPAMVKALLINGAVDTGAGGPIPNREQGWGRIHLNNILNPATPAVYLDQEILLRPSSPAVEFELETVDPTRPLKITLIWTDALGNPGSGTAGNPALVNALGLRMSQGDFTWFGNNFAGGWSQIGGIQDAVQSINPGRIVNNVQNIFIQHPSGRYTVQITPESIAGDCMNVAGDVVSSDFKQDFALAIQNARLAPGSTLAITLVVDPTHSEEEITGAASNLVFLPLVIARHMEETQRAAQFLTTLRPRPEGSRGVNGAQPAAEETAEHPNRLAGLTRAAHSLADASIEPLSRKVIVLVSNGDDSQLPSAQEIERLRKEHRIHTVGLGDTVDGRRLQAIAQSTHGAFWHVFNPNQRAVFFHEILAEESDAEVVNHVTGVLTDHSQVATFPVIASDHTLIFLIHWDDPAVVLESELIAPDGEVITPDRTQRSSRMHYTRRATGILYRVERPRRPDIAWEGDWSVKISCDTARQAPFGFSISALVHSSLRLTLQWDEREYRADESLRLKAQVVDNEQVLTQGLHLQVCTQTASPETLFAETETTATTTFVLDGEDDTPVSPEEARFDTPHSAEVKTYLYPEQGGIHTHWIHVQGHAASGAPFTRTRLVSRYLTPAREEVADSIMHRGIAKHEQMRALGEVSGREAVSAHAQAGLVVVGKVEELCYDGDGLFQGFTLRTQEDSYHIPTRAQPLAEVIVNALQQDLRVAVLRQPGSETIAEVRLLSQM